MEVLPLCDNCSSFKGRRISFDYPLGGKSVRVVMSGVCLKCGYDIFGQKFKRHEGLLSQILKVSPTGYLNVDWLAYSQVRGRANGGTELEINEILVYLGKLTLAQKGAWRFSNPEMNPFAFDYSTSVGFLDAADAREYASVMRKKSNWSLVHVDKTISSKEALCEQ